MGETCEVCGRISVRTTLGSGVPGTPIDKVCFRVKAGADTTCYQVGYERSQEALAAARRECEGLRTHLRNMVDMADYHVLEIECIAEKDRTPGNITRAQRARANYDAADALAAPAASEEK